jgi:putative Mg2+ transporter-C (MgtC) family protein
MPQIAPLHFHIGNDELIKLALAILCGGILGIERQYKNKTAGFRTIILICLGSALFTMIAQQAGLGVNINVITGIGFIGAGVIFKDSIAVSGLTTAAVIWVSAAIGMAVGAGDYLLAIITAVITVTALTLFHILENYIDKLHHDRLFYFVFTDTDYKKLLSLEDKIKHHHLKSKVLRISMHNDNLEAAIMVTGHKKQLRKLDEELLQMPHIKSF